MKKDIKRNFTLMELLAVIAIVSVLFTVMLPGFKKMVKGNAVDQMASQVKLMIEKMAVLEKLKEQEVEQLSQYTELN